LENKYPRRHASTVLLKSIESLVLGKNDSCDEAYNHVENVDANHIYCNDRLKQLPR
jgi:hypothetical protein